MAYAVTKAAQIQLFGSGPIAIAKSWEDKGEFRSVLYKLSSSSTDTTARLMQRRDHPWRMMQLTVLAELSLAGHQRGDSRIGQGCSGGCRACATGGTPTAMYRCIDLSEVMDTALAHRQAEAGSRWWVS